MYASLISLITIWKFDMSCFEILKLNIEESSYPKMYKGHTNNMNVLTNNKKHNDLNDCLYFMMIMSSSS